VDDHDAVSHGAQPLSDARAEKRAFADAARSVKDGQTVREEVRNDRLALELAPEEEQRVDGRVAKGGKSLVRARR
jgi:hypothetical protein